MFGSPWGFWESWPLASTEPFRILASVRLSHPAFLIILINKPVALAFAIGFVCHHFSFEDPPVNELFLGEFFNKNVLSFFEIESVETFCGCDFLSRKLNTVEFLQHGQFVDHLESVVLALLDGVVGKVDCCEVHQVFEVLDFSDVLYGVLGEVQLS